MRHCIYKLCAQEQLSAPRLGPTSGEQCPYRTRELAKGLLRAYQHVHARVHAGPKALKEYLVSTAMETIVAWTSSEAELYVRAAWRAGWRGRGEGEV